MKRLASYSDQSELLYDIHNFNISPPSREVYLHGWPDTIDDAEIGMEFRMATQFEKNMNFLNMQGKTNILIHQHSIGGEWNDGIAMHNTIESSKSPVTMLAYAHARSMSSITIQAADNRVIMPDADFMIHYGYVAFEGESIAHETLAALNGRINDRMMDLYAQRCQEAEPYKKKSIKQIKAMLDKEIRKGVDWYMTPDEAIYHGFLDGVLGTEGFEDLEAIR